MKIELYNMLVESKHPSLFARGIQIALYGSNYSVDRVHHSADLVVIDGVGYVYEAVETYSVTPFKKWVGDYHVKNICDVRERYNISDQEAAVCSGRFDSFVGIKYGKASIVGIVLYYVIKAKTVGVDETARIICSEGSIRGYGDLIPYPFYKPKDYVTPKDLYQLFYNKDSMALLHKVKELYG